MAALNYKKLLDYFQKSIIGYDHVIDQIYYHSGIAGLKEFVIELMAVDFAGKETVDKYLESKIRKIESDEELKKEQTRLDIKHKKRQLKWFYPLIIFTVVSLGVAIFSAWSNFIKKEDSKERIEYLEKKVKSIEANIWFLSRKQMADSTRSASSTIQTK